MRNLIRILGLSLSLLPASFAGNIVGTSNLLTTSYVQQLEAWLNEGALTLTLIFDFNDGDGQTAAQFHEAANDKGRTIVVFRGRDPFGDPTWQIFGGYNPQSWTNNGWKITQSNDDRNAFLFNLSSGVRQDQRKTDDIGGSGYGQWQTYNDSMQGPTFGYGNDLFVNNTLNFGSVKQYSYGPSMVGSNSTNIAGTAGFLPVGFSDIEVFTISEGVAAAVPEPSALTMLAGGLGLLILSRCKRPKV